MSMMPKPEHPRPDRMRAHWYALNGTWDFALFADGEQEAERLFAQHREAYPDEIAVPYSWTCPLSGIERDVAGIGWYRRSVCFDVAGRIFLCFGAVDYQCNVFVNGQHVTSHMGGYTPFEVDVSDVWGPGENLIEVRAEDFRLESQTYGKQGYGEIQGIWQTAWLEERPAAHIDWFRFVTRISGEVEVHASVHLSGVECGTLVGEFDGRRFEVAATPDNAADVVLPMHFDAPRLWSPDSPSLYEGTLSFCSEQGKDVVETYFGIREIGYAAAPGRSFPWITLNGKPIYLNGTLDQAFNPQGYFTYPDEASIRDEAWRLKRLGLNMVRIHIKPEEPRKLYWMDRLGILVVEDMPCFWGEPDETARRAYELEWPDVIRRDINHPSVFSWVMFNETWGLLSKAADDRVYLPETQAWVRDVYRRAKALDPSRLVEDNSACRYDHVETDLNTWHFYINGYGQVRDHIREVAENAYPGSAHNFIGGAQQTAVPLMNSECGMVWGVDGSAGDSDLAWQYHYMLNEFRLQEKICGFVFTEFNDVVNEFNGYYRIDDTEKDFGYGAFCRGMTLRDLHAADFVAMDAPPCRTVSAGERVDVPLALSSFSDQHHEKGVVVRWELWHEGMDGPVCDVGGEIPVSVFDYGVTKLLPLSLTMPHDSAVAVLSIYLMAAAGEVISRNFTTFDVRGNDDKHIIQVPVTACDHTVFSPVWQAQRGEKLCFGGSGEATYTVALPEGMKALTGLTLLMEAGSKRVLKKDLPEEQQAEGNGDFMRGYRVDRGAFANSYPMTDESRFPSAVEVLVNGVSVETLPLRNDWADARGVLSWHYQPDDRKLDEAGSYGERFAVDVPSRLIPSIAERGSLRLTLRVTGGGGLSLYGRNSGRYPFGLTLRARTV